MEPVYLFGGPTPPAKPTEAELALGRKLKRRRGFLLTAVAGTIGVCGFVVGRGSAETASPPGGTGPEPDLVQRAVELVHATAAPDLPQHLDVLVAALTMQPHQESLLFALQSIVDQELARTDYAGRFGAIETLTQLLAPKAAETRWSHRHAALEAL